MFLLLHIQAKYNKYNIKHLFTKTCFDRLNFVDGKWRGLSEHLSHNTTKRRRHNNVHKLSQI